MEEVCAECGSKPDYRPVEVTSLASTTREYEQMAWRCSNRACVNHDTRNLTMGWTTTKERWDASHPA